MTQSPKFIITLLILTLSPRVALADTAVSYELISSMLQIAESFTLVIYEALTEKFANVFALIASFILLIHAGRWAFGKVDLLGIIKLLIAIVVVNSIALTAGAFEEWFYQPVMKTVYALPAFIIKIANGGTFNISDSDALKNMLTSLDSAIETMLSIAYLIAGEGSFLSSIWLYFKAGVLIILYYGLYSLFVAIFLIGILSAHAMLIVAPIAISLFAFDQLRGISYNILRSFLSYSLVPFFAAVAMGMTLQAIKTLVVEAQYIVQAQDASMISTTFYSQAILMAIVSWYFHLKSSEFASQVMGGFISNAGGGLARASGATIGSVSSYSVNKTRGALRMATRPR